MESDDGDDEEVTEGIDSTAHSGESFALPVKKWRGDPTCLLDGNYYSSPLAERRSPNTTVTAKPQAPKQLKERKPGYLLAHFVYSFLIVRPGRNSIGYEASGLRHKARYVIA